MSSSCCKRSATLSSKLRSQLDHRLEVVANSVPFSTGPVALFAADGKLVTTVTGKGPEAASETREDGRRDEADAVGPTLSALRLASARFANTLQVTECPTIHVKGEAYLFSCYTVGTHYLAMYSSPPGDLEDYDTMQLDARVGPKLEELEMFLQSCN